MGSILFNNDNDSSKGKNPEPGIAKSPLPVETGKAENPTAALRGEEFAIFPQWDVLPPNAIINPRIKKNI